jgi:membrane-bound lytic murein transglycosylase MltF
MLTSLLTNAAFAPQVAVPVEVRTMTTLEKVSAKEFSKALLTKKQYACFTKLIGKESAWNHKAENPTTTAKGIGQLLQSTYNNLGMKHSNDAVAQTVATLAYIGRKYGSGGPCAAWEFWKKNNWY